MGGHAALEPEDARRASTPTDRCASSVDAGATAERSAGIGDAGAGARLPTNFALRPGRIERADAHPKRADRATFRHGVARVRRASSGSVAARSPDTSAEANGGRIRRSDTAPPGRGFVVGRADDPAEAEADAAAVRVVAAIALAEGGGPHRTSGGASIRRRSAEAVGLDGGPVDESTDVEIRRAVGRGRPLESGIRRSMESGFGADFSGVRVHTGPHADDLNARLGAQAFTVGSDIFFSGGQPDIGSRQGRHLVAHELAHTLQQGGTEARRRTVVRRLELGARPIAGGYAKILAHPTWRQRASTFEKRLGAAAYQHPKAITAARACLKHMAQLLTVEYGKDFADINDLYRTAFTKDDTSSAGQVGKHLSDTAQFDMLFNNAGNLREVMTMFYNGAYYNAGYGEDLNPSLKKILHDVTISKKWDLARKHKLDEADLRIRSAALLSWSRALKYQAARLVNEDKAHIFSQDIFALGELAGSVGNAAELAMSQMPRSDRTDVEKAQGAAKKTPREYALMGAPLSDQERAYLLSKDKPLTVQGFDIVEVEWDDWNLDGSGMPTLSTQDQGAGVTLEIKYEREADGKSIARWPDGSPRIEKVYKIVPAEKTITGARQSDLKPNEAGPELPLEWVEGKAWFKLDPSSSWVKKVQDQLGAEVIAGVSGTTTRMMSAMKWMKVPGVDPFDFRLAVMGWMLTSQDHSLYEIFRGAEFAGFKGSESTDDAISMYMNVPPLTTEELRASVCENRMFPHELVYMEMIGQGIEGVADIDSGAKPAGVVEGFVEPGEETVDVAANRLTDLYDEVDTPGTGTTELTNWLADLGVTAPDIAKRLSPAHAVALAGYTGGMHSLLNTVLTMPAPLAKLMLASKLKSVLAYYAEADHLEELETATTISPEQQTRLDYLRTHYEEWTATLDQLGPRDDVRKEMSDPARSAEQRLAAVQRYQGAIAPLVDPLYEELRVHANMSIEALNVLPAVTGKTVYRGDWKGAVSWAYGSKNMTVSQLMSTTTDIDTAKEFAERYSDGTVSHPVLFEMKLTGKGGRNIGFLSEIQAENEILLMPGTKFTVTASKYVGKVEQITMTET